MLDKPFAGFRRRNGGPRFIHEPRPQGIAPLIAAILASVVGAIASKAMEQKQAGPTGQPMNTKYEPTTKGAMEEAAARAGGTANVGRALGQMLPPRQALTADELTPQPLPTRRALTADELTPQALPQGRPLTATNFGSLATSPSPAGMGAEVGPPKPTPEQLKQNAQGEGSWMDAARMGVAVGGGIADRMTPKQGPIGGLFHGSASTDTTLPSAKERLLRYLASMNRGA